MEYIARWHLAQKSGQLAFGDNRDILVGVPMEVDVMPNVGRRGLHAAPSVIDAFKARIEGILCLVEGSGEVDMFLGQFSYRRRTVLASFGVQGTFALRRMLVNQVLFERISRIPHARSPLKLFMEDGGYIPDLFDFTKDRNWGTTIDLNLSQEGKRVMSNFFTFCDQFSLENKREILTRAAKIVENCKFLCCFGLESGVYLSQSETAFVNQLSYALIQQAIGQNGGLSITIDPVISWRP